MKTNQIKLHVSEIYDVGAILKYSWGYDQTNIDFFCIVKISEKFLTLLPMRSVVTRNTGWAMGKSIPTTIDESAKPIRRKLAKDGKGIPFGVAIRSYGWCKLWNGKEAEWTAYA
jgi:hypothetical protein